ncbi:MAG: cell surface protein SprA [Bacteroidales bacterium]
MFKRLRYLIYIFLVLIGGTGICSAFTAFTHESMYAFPTPLIEETPEDTLKMPFPIRKTVPENTDDLDVSAPLDLKTPENIKSEVEYDPFTDSYIFRTKIGEQEVSIPISMTAQEYKAYTEKQLMQSYFRSKNAEIFEKGDKSEFNFLDMKFGLGPAEKIFGPGGVQVKTQGSAEISFGMKQNKVDNPTLPAKSRSKTFFDFDEKIQLNVNAKVGDKMSFGMNYNTDATFDFDSKQLKLAYQGKEDEIIKSLEAGNVSMTTGSSLIRGGAALFGMKAALQFGKLNITTLIAQQESTTQTVNSKGGAQTRPFEFMVDAYDEDRHFFLAHYFRDNYDQFVSKLPYVSSGIEISRIEVWVTNKRGNYDQARNMVAFMDLAESTHIANSHWIAQSGLTIPFNDANNLYRTIVDNYPGARNINQVTQVLAPLAVYGIEGGSDYEKVESARKMSENEYILNKQLGYISLKSKLNPDEVLAVAFEYTVNGKPYQVGEFSTTNENTQESLYLKLLKGTSINPTLPMWDLMMKNVYALPGAYQIQKEKFRLDIQYMSDTAGVYLNYIQAGNIRDQLLLRVMNLDRLDRNNEANPDSYFDFIEGYTVQAATGRVIFPSVEPFGSYLANKIGDPVLAQKYCYFELYDSTLTVARQIAEKNKFRMKGEYRASSGAEISLNAMNVPRGSVVVTAGGMRLTENTDYTVDYTMGVVTILNQSILESGTNISVSLESQSMFSTQRKTMLGLDMQYNFSKNFVLGGTVMHLSEKPLTNKVTMDNIPLKNTIYGFNANYKTEYMWLTNLMGMIPWVNATAPSTFSLTAEYAQLIPGHSKSIKDKGEVYLDDFESSQSSYDLRTPYAWQLASTPYDPSANGLFPEAGLSNDIRYGQNRALLSWYYIDRLFTQKTSSLTPSHIKKDADQLSNHYVREVNFSEIYPNKELNYGESGILTVLNMSYYPTERGPYNLDVDGMDELGNLTDPEKRWGGMMRKMENTDFEANNYEYIQFWVLDPFIYDTLGVNGGDLYFNLGEVSEDILKDGMKSFENGMPIDGDTTYLATTAWGRVSRRTSTVYAFDNAEGARKKQDIGFDGLSTEDEYSFSTYKHYFERVQGKLSAEGFEKMKNDPFSALNDPAGDNFHHFRGSDFDDRQVDILSRYKHYNGVEGNSTASEDSPEKYDVSSKTVPDVEDINQDNTLNEYERYFQYKISLRAKDLQVGQNFVSDKKSAKVRLRNGKEETVNWYQFKVPLRDYEKQVGSIRDFKTIRFIRMFMTGFPKSTHLRFASLELMRGDWRTYSNPLYKDNVPPVTNGQIDVSVVNIEENAGQVPVNYVMPPGVTRVVDPGQSQITQLNEQSMALNVLNLAPADARAVYKNVSFDMRQFKRLQMFVHGEALIDNDTDLKSGELSVFLRVGSDYKDNYYEYEIPVTLTSPGIYNNNSLTDRKQVWPEDNMFNFALSTFTDLKLARNAEKRKSYSNVTYQSPYSIYDPENRRNRVTIVGNPSLADVRTVMIGIRNNSRSVKAGTFWVDELRLAEFNEKGGWAGRANANIGVSDIATINLGGQIETAGFGSIDQSLTERRMDDYYQYNIATTVDVGRLLPEKAKLKAPLFYSYSKEIVSPEYDPYNQDIRLEQSLENVTTSHEKDSIKQMAQEVAVVESFSLSGVKVNIQSEKPMPWDPANFSASYSFTRTSKSDPTTQYEDNKDYRGALSYVYSPFIKPWTPFAGINSKSPHLRLARDFSLNWLPNNIGLYSNLHRTYYEQQLRNIDESGQSDMQLPVSFSKNFLWDRQTSLNWDLTKALRFSFMASTNSRVDEPNVPVNKRLFPDDYELWKDSVQNSLLKLGSPLKYNQNFDAAFTVPLNKIPYLDWSTASLKYNGTYGWNRGVFVDEFTQLGNSVNNQMQAQGDLRLNMENLYNKSKFLKDVNRKFASNSRGNAGRRVTPASKKRFTQRVQLKSDTTTTVKHNLDNKNIKVTAVNSKKESYPIKYIVKDKNSIVIQTRDNQAVQLTIVQGKRPEEEIWYKVAQYSTRGLMLVRNISVNYKRTNSTFLPSFEPNVGDFLGQNNDRELAPGLGFAFGFDGGESYVNKAIENEWLIVNDSLTSPAIFSTTDDFQYKILLEPIRGLKIDLTGSRVHTRSKQYQFMFQNVPIQQSGSFTMTTIAIRTSLTNPKSENNYQSDAFDRFISYRSKIATRLNAQYAGTTYPAGSSLGGASFDPNLTGNRLNSGDVMIPAFLAAYTGRNPDKMSMSVFPSIKSILPNWRITYDGLIRIPGLDKYFRSITLSHAYRCVYSVGSFSSYLNWIESNNGLGFILDQSTNMPIPSSPFDLSMVSLTESFMPLIGLDFALKNGVTGKIEYKDTRNLSLNMSSVQVIEALSKDFTIGAGYKIANFNTVIGMKGGGQKGVNHDLTFRADLTHRKQNAIIRKVQENYSQATSGNKNFTMKFTADYTFSKYLTIRAYFDKQINTPLVSNSSYPISNANYGITLRLALTR